MTYANYDDALGQLQAAGFDLHDIEVGRMKRCKVRDLSQKGWYSLHEIKLDDGRYALVGAYGWWIGGEKFVKNIDLRIGKEAMPLSSDQQAAIRQRIAEEKKRADAARRAENEKAAQAAAAAWRGYVTEGSSDYLVRKHVGAHGIRFAPSGAGTLAVPMTDSAGKVWGLQLIRGKARPAGKLEKEYWPKGLAKQGKYHLIGGVPRDILLLAEGYATAATLHQATGLPVAVAFDAGNLLPVAQALHKAHPRVKILICADDDYLTEGNPGVKAAEAAALAVGGAVAVPQFSIDRENKKITDFNDLAEREGEGVVLHQISARLAALEWGTQAKRPPSGAGLQEQGGGGKQPLAAMITVDEAVERYALVYGGKGTLFDFNEHALVPKGDVLDILPPRAWDQLKTHPDWRAMRLAEVGFDPAGTDTGIVGNLWGGWPTVPKPGQCEVLLELLRFLCSGEKNAEALYTWVLKWLAYPIQHPGAKMKTALIFHGPQGAGKNMFFEAVMEIYGEYGRIVDQTAIEDKFNDWASRKLFLIADEVVARAELFHVKNKLKGFVTGEWIRINPKQVAAHDERNHVNIVFLSNETQPLVLEKDDRRYTVVWTPEKMPLSFYDDVKAEIAAGGIAALHHHLATLDLGDFAPHTNPPMTAAKRDLIEVSQGSTERFVQDWVRGEITIGGKMLPFCPAQTTQIYTAYSRWCRIEGVARPREQSQFSGFLRKLPGWEGGVLKDRYRDLNYGGTTLRERMILPSDADLEAHAKLGHPDLRRKPDESQAKWITDCFFAIKEVLDIQP